MSYRKEYYEDALLDLPIALAANDTATIAKCREYLDTFRGEYEIYERFVHNLLSTAEQLHPSLIEAARQVYPHHSPLDLSMFLFPQLLGELKGMDCDDHNEWSHAGGAPWEEEFPEESIVFILFHRLLQYRWDEAASPISAEEQAINQARVERIKRYLVLTQMSEVRNDPAALAHLEAKYPSISLAQWRQECEAYRAHKRSAFVQTTLLQAKAGLLQLSLEEVPVELPDELLDLPDELLEWLRAPQVPMELSNELLGLNSALDMLEPEG